MSYELLVGRSRHMWTTSATRFNRSTKHIVLHGTRGGKPERGRHGEVVEAHATVNWFNNPDSGASTEFVVHPGSKVTVILAPGQQVPGTDDELLLAGMLYAHWHLGIGPNDPAFSAVGIEVPQEFLGDIISDEVIATTVELVNDIRRLKNIPARWVYPKKYISTTDAGIYEHSNVNPEKSDIGLDRKAFMEKVLRADRPAPVKVVYTTDLEDRVSAVEARINKLEDGQEATRVVLGSIDEDMQRAATNLVNAGNALR